MTRTDAKAAYKGWLAEKGERRLAFLGDTYHIIDIIYDDFENRTCSACSSWKNEECELLLYFTGDYNCYMATEADFGCNKWSPR